MPLDALVRPLRESTTPRSFDSFFSLLGSEIRFQKPEKELALPPYDADENELMFKPVPMSINKRTLVPLQVFGSAFHRLKVRRPPKGRFSQ